MRESATLVIQKVFSIKKSVILSRLWRRTCGDVLIVKVLARLFSESWLESPAKPIKSQIFREVLRPKSGLRMTVVSTHRLSPTALSLLQRTFDTLSRRSFTPAARLYLRFDDPDFEQHAL